MGEDLTVTVECEKNEENHVEISMTVRTGGGWKGGIGFRRKTGMFFIRFSLNS